MPSFMSASQASARGLASAQAALNSQVVGGGPAKNQPPRASARPRLTLFSEWRYDPWSMPVAMMTASCRFDHEFDDYRTGVIIADAEGTRCVLWWASDAGRDDRVRAATYVRQRFDPLVLAMARARVREAGLEAVAWARRLMLVEPRALRMLVDDILMHGSTFSAFWSAREKNLRQHA